MTLDDNSEKLLNGVHTDLVAVVHRARDLTEFRVTEGLRSIQRQKQLVAQKKSQTLKSRHITGHAVDLVDLEGSYAEPEMKRIADAMKAAATELGIKLVWGGDWTTLEDTPHFELERHAYPESDMKTHVKNIAIGTVSGGSVVSVPAVPKALDSAVTNIETHMAIGSRLATLAKGVLTFELGSMVGLAGIIIVAVCMFWPNGGADVGQTD